MNILEYLASINKISLVVLAIIFLFLLYELYLYRKDRRKQAVVSVPSFGNQPPPTPAAKPVATPIQQHIPTAHKQRRKLSKKTVGMVTASIVMVTAIGAISYRLSQPAVPGNTVAPQSPRAAALPTTEPQPNPTTALEPSSIPTNGPGISPTSRPLLLARNLSPTPIIFAKAITPTVITEPTIFSSPTAIPTAPLLQPSPTSAFMAAVSPTSVESLPKSGLPHYSAFLFGLASFIIVASFLF